MKITQFAFDLEAMLSHMLQIGMQQEMNIQAGIGHESTVKPAERTCPNNRISKFHETSEGTEWKLASLGKGRTVKRRSLRLTSLPTTNDPVLWHELKSPEPS
jgi:hypothetical protein